jgi:hypothetical protein
MSLLDDATPVGEVPKHLISVLYGPPGVGKTIALARTANKTLLLTDERAHVSLSNFPELNVRVIQFKNYDHVTGIVRELYGGDHDYGHLMIDTFDGLIRKKLKEQRETIQFTRHKQTNDINSLEDYNLLNNHMFDFIGRLAKLPLSVSLTSHDRIPDQQAYVKGDRLLRPSIPFRIFECLNGYANVVGYMQMGQKGRVISLQANREHEAKNHLRMEPMVSDDIFVETIRNWKGI